MTDQNTQLHQTHAAFTCPQCGGDILGDGYTTVLHCEFAPEEEIQTAEPDADPIWCNFEE